MEMSKDGMSAEQIQQTYLTDLEKALEEHYKEIEWDKDVDGICFLEECYRYCELSWPSINYARFVWPSRCALTSANLAFFAKSDVVWMSPSAGVKDGELVVEVLLIDWYPI